MRRRVTEHWVFGAACLALGLAALTAAAQDVSVRVAVESTDVYVGQPFVFQIQIQGSDASDTPDLSGLADFSAESMGGRQNNSQSVTIINGKVTQNVSRGYILSYRLTAKRVGRLTIPALTVNAGGTAYQTQPLTITCRKPQQTDDFKLKVAFSRDRCYVGEPVLLTVTWYISMDVRNFAFAIPALDDKRFSIEDPDLSQDPNSEYYRVPLSSGEAVALKGRGTLDGKTYATLSFQKVLIPREAGVFDFPEATVACEALVGYERSRGGRSFFDDFFSDDFFSLGRQGVYKNFVTPSGAMRLDVAPVPEEGKPANFSGLVGRYTIEADAAPTEVNVGDPITLTIRVSGSEYLKSLELPPLQNQAALAGRFKIPQEMAPGKIEGSSKVFTQTVRAVDTDVTEIPPIELGYFDSEKGRYEVARSKAIPLTVRATRVVTAEDAEGREPERARNQLTLWQEGIAHNYLGEDVLKNQAYGLNTWMQSPLWLAAIAVPPFLYAALALSVFLRRRRDANPELRRVRRAYGALSARLQGLGAQPDGGVYSPVLEALRSYLGDKLGMTAAALTYRDVQEPLLKRGVGEEALSELRAIFDACEAHQYAGGQRGGETPGAFIERVLNLAKALEKGIGK